MSTDINGIENQHVRRHYEQGGLANHTNFSAICEFVDNSFDAKASTIRIEYRSGYEVREEVKRIAREQKIDEAKQKQHQDDHEDNIISENYRMKTDENSALYKLKSPALFIQDDGTGLKKISQILDVGSNVEHTEHQDFQKGMYGMGAKDAIARLGEYSLILSRAKPTNSLENQQELDTGFYRYLLGIYPLEETRINLEDDDKSLHVDRKLKVNRFANFTLKVDENVKINRDILQNQDFNLVKKFMKNHSPFDDVDILDMLECLLRQMSVDFKPKKNAATDAEVQGTMIMIWGIRQQKDHKRKKRLSTAQNSQLNKRRNDNRPNSPSTFLENTYNDIQEHGVVLHSKDDQPEPDVEFEKSSLIVHLSEYFAYHKTRSVMQDKRSKMYSNSTPCIFVQGIRVHPKIFRTILKKESIVMMNMIFKGALDTPTFEIGELKSTCSGDSGIGIGQGINYYWKNRFIKRVPYPRMGNHAIFIDLGNVAKPSQYKNDFIQNLILEKKQGSTFGGVFKFIKLEQKLKELGREHNEKVIKMQNKNLWKFEDYEYDEAKSEGEGGTFFVQCLKCGKIREILMTQAMLQREFQTLILIDLSDF